MCVLLFHSVALPLYSIIQRFLNMLFTKFNRRLIRSSNSQLRSVPGDGFRFRGGSGRVGACNQPGTTNVDTQQWIASQRSRRCVIFYTHTYKFTPVALILAGGARLTYNFRDSPTFDRTLFVSRVPSMRRASAKQPYPAPWICINPFRSAYP